MTKNQLQEDISLILSLINEYVDEGVIDFYEPTIKRLYWYVERDLSYEGYSDD